MTTITLVSHFKCISNENLIKEYLTPAMRSYFNKKLKNEDPDYIILKLTELLKFLILSTNTHGDIPFNNEIDEIWHLWILQTAQYQDLMRKLPSKRFIHHCSNDYTDESNDQPVDQTAELNRQVSYLASYIYNFGYFSNKIVKFWPMISTLMEALQVDLEGLNKYLFNLASKYIDEEYNNTSNNEV